jgi:hypothetical protein
MLRVRETNVFTTRNVAFMSVAVFGILGTLAILADYDTSHELRRRLPAYAIGVSAPCKYRTRLNENEDWGSLMGGTILNMEDKKEDWRILGYESTVPTEIHNHANMKVEWINGFKRHDRSAYSSGQDGPIQLLYMHDLSENRKLIKCGTIDVGIAEVGEYYIPRLVFPNEAGDYINWDIVGENVQYHITDPSSKYDEQDDAPNLQDDAPNLQLWFEGCKRRYLFTFLDTATLRIFKRCLRRTLRETNLLNESKPSLEAMHGLATKGKYTFKPFKKW